VLNEVQLDDGFGQAQLDKERAAEIGVYAARFRQDTGRLPYSVDELENYFGDLGDYGKGTKSRNQKAFQLVKKAAEKAGYSWE
jgi:hypothetical protein